MLPNLAQNPKLPPLGEQYQYTLVLDLDETLIHYFEQDGLGNYDIRPGMPEFLARMSSVGFELVIFTAATQDYADWVIDQIDPGGLIHHRLYRQHALPWGPIFVKDLSKLGRDLDRTLIVDNVQENFMLQPNNGIFIYTWYDDPQDTALTALTPLLEELISTKMRVPDILDKYCEEIPQWAGFEVNSQLGEFSDFDLPPDDVPEPKITAPASYTGYPQPAAGGGYVQTPYPATAATAATNLERQRAQAQAQAQLQPPPQQQQQLQQQQFGGRCQQQPPLTQYPQSRPAAGGYQQQAQQPPQAPPQQPSSPQPARQPAPASKQPQHQQQPQSQPQRQGVSMTGQRPHAPPFSGVAGPYQAAPPSQGVRQVGTAQMWSRAGVGPCQAPRHGHR